MLMVSKIVHLDQKNWIELARGYYGKAPEFRKIAQEVFHRSQSGQMIFPLSITHLSETLRTLNRDRRQRLARYMVSVSQGWAILPASTIIVPEIENACLKHLGLPEYDLQKFAIKKGMSQLLGAKADLVIKDPDKLPQRLKRQLFDRIESPETLLWFLEQGVERPELRKMQQDLAASTNKLQQIRSLDESQIRDNDLRRRATCAKYLIQVVNPEIVRFLLSVKVNPKVFADQVFTDQKNIIRFFQSMPTSYCLVQLTLYRDMQRARRIQPNDLSDITSLSIAIPYSDVVVTETMWQHAIIQTKLDELRPTTILKSSNELTPILDSN